MAVAPVPKSELGQLQELGGGAFGTVYKTSYKLPGDPTELAYKEYNFDSAGNRRKSGETATKAFIFRETFTASPGDLEILDRYFAWPRQMVVDDAWELCGFLMQAAPADFYLRLPSKQTSGLRTLDFLASGEQFWQDNNMAPPDLTETDRLFLMMQLVYAVAWLHKKGWVFGDLSYKNVAFAERPPRLILFDCDEASDLGDPKRENLSNTAFWVPPECKGGHKQDSVTDVYKLGLAIVRYLKPARGALSTDDVQRLADVLDPEGIDLLEGALSEKRADRPTAKKIFAYLEQLTVPRMVPPTIADAQLVTPLVLKGSRGRVQWTIDNAEQVEVLLGENPPQRAQTVDPANSPNECTFPVAGSGQVTLVATNRHGSATRVVGDVALLEIPPMNVDFDQLPQANIPQATSFSSGPLPPLPDYPRAPDIPAISPLEIADTLREPLPDQTIVPISLAIGLLIGNSRSLIDLVHTGAEHHFTELRRKIRQRVVVRRGR